MFDRIRKAFSPLRQAPEQRLPPASMASPLAGKAADWAAGQGFTVATQSGATALAFEGRVAGKGWRMELGRPGRKYIRGEELRGRAELDIDPDVLVVAMNRPLKESLEKQAYALYTDSLQTSVDPSLPEEMRLLAMHEEVGWDSMPRVFWSRYAVVADDRGQAQSWVDAELAHLLMEWPEPAPAAELPVLLMLLRGRAYLRMEQGPDALPALQHATRVFGRACENAVKAFS
ncbi:hypothetical protein PE066_00930 [Ramlibacter tataouinensis]|uniref:hypothetical protein n=1 Tax=Ramlibacter tataouinensis TaxID=94132 RepID=UPI0022F39DD1|nr:hypothetical protein [Ramlibacter tataouinensis]WBY02134.1 hypothetical protein PE066_00930 [Ramlibacter tataouinensis]